MTEDEYRRMREMQERKRREVPSEPAPAFGSGVRQQMLDLMSKNTGYTVEECADMVDGKCPIPSGYTKPGCGGPDVAKVAAPTGTVDRRTLLLRGIPELHLRNVFDQEPKGSEAYAVCCTFLPSDLLLLVLSGGVGTCKTGSACWALTQKTGLFFQAASLSRFAAAKEGDMRARYRMAHEVDLLVLDDVGSEYLDDKGWFVQQFETLIDTRYAAARKTILTTNLDDAAFQNAYGPRVWDRIRERGRFRRIGGTSVRGQSAAAHAAKGET